MWQDQLCMDASPEVVTLLDRVRRGDDAAAAELITMHYPHVARIVRANLPRGEAIEDLIQEVFLRIFSRLGSYRGDAPFGHWVARLSVNVCIDHLRAHRRRPELRWSDLGETGQDILRESLAVRDSGAGARASEARELVDRLLSGLRAEQQLVIRMLDLEERPVAEVARITGWSEGLVRVRAFRARRALQQQITRLSEEEKP